MDDHGADVATLADGSSAIQVLSVRNDSTRPYDVKVWSRPAVATVSYPESTVARTASFSDSADPGDVFVGRERIAYSDGNRTTPQRVGIDVTVDARRDGQGALEQLDLPRQHIDCVP